MKDLMSDIWWAVPTLRLILNPRIPHPCCSDKVCWKKRNILILLYVDSRHFAAQTTIENRENI